MDLNLATTSLTVWAQNPANATPGPPVWLPTTSQPYFLAIRRWYSTLTLSPPDNFAGFRWLWPILLGLLALFCLAALLQGPVKTLAQAVDIKGLIRLYGDAVHRVKSAWRLLAIIVGSTVLAWTVSQTLNYDNPQGREDLATLTKGRSPVTVALENGGLAAATPLRDIVSLGNTIPLLIIVAVVVFQFSTDRWGSVTRVISQIASRQAFWGTIGWGSCALYAAYRIIGLLYRSFDTPLGNCLGAEVVVVPIITPIADGLMLAWCAVELRNASLADSNANENFDVPGVVNLIPAAAFVAFMLMPGRYIATAVELLIPYLPVALIRGYAFVNQYISWQLGWGVITLQAAAIVTIGFAGVLPWSRGTIRHVVSRYIALLKQEGGHLFSLLLSAGLMAGALAFLAYFFVLSLPTQTWVLSAADGYSHYATLGVGLVLLAGLVELGERTLPEATLPGLADPEA